MRIHRLFVPLLVSISLAALAPSVAGAASMLHSQGGSRAAAVNCPTDSRGVVIGPCDPQALPDIRCQAGQHANPSPDPLGYYCVTNGY